MSKIMIFILLPLFSFILSQECILGKNCPYNQGFCAGTTCECLDGYRILFNPKLPQVEQIFCNYKQKHHIIALALEVFLPGFGHFYTAHYWLGLIKLALCLAFIWSSYYLYDQMRIPGYVEALKKTILNKILEPDGGPRETNGGISTRDIAQLLFNITFHPFWIFWLVDIYLYFTKTYYDGNEVELF